MNFYRIVLLIVCASFTIINGITLPEPPSNVKVSEITAISVRLAWSYSGPEDVQYYVVQFKPKYANQAYSEISGIIAMYCSVRNLSPYTEYEMYVIAVNNIGRGPPSAPTVFATGGTASEPGTYPRNVQVRPLSSSTIVIQWDEPETPNGQVTGYKVYYTTTPQLAISQWQSQMVDNNQLTTISDLTPHTIYTIRVQAFTSLAPGPLSLPVHVKTQQGVPSQPTNLRPSDVNQTTMTLQWSKPTHYGENIVSYELYWNDTCAKEKHHQRISVSEGYTLTGLYPNTLYYVWLAARSQRGEGATTPPISVQTKHFGASSVQTSDSSQRTNLNVPTDNDAKVSSQEDFPMGPPTNISHQFQTPDVVCITWDPPSREHRNGQITKYDIQFHKKSDHSNIIERNVTNTKAVFTNLEENTEYFFHIRAYTSQGTGPFSEKISIHTERDIGRPPMSVRAVATSDSSVEVWWEPVPSRGQVIGYQLFYTMTAVEDLDEWQQKTVGLTESADLINLEKFAQYAIAVAARLTNGLGRLSEKVTVKVKPEDVPLDLRAYDVTTHSMTLSWSPPIHLNPISYKISFDAVKEFVDAQGITQTETFDKVEIPLKHNVKSYTINNLSPFTTYNVNVSAIPTDYAYRPSTKITVTTQMAAPKPMAKPDLYGVVNHEEIIVILPQASEEYGPISHYYLIVVPEDKEIVYRNTDEYLTDSIIDNQKKNPDDPAAPYIAAKFPQRNIPYTFHLGSGEEYNGFKNRKLEPTKKYRFFVRAVVDAHEQYLYTSSPFSNSLSLDMASISTSDYARV